MSRLWLPPLAALLLVLLGCEPRGGDDSRLDNRPPQTHLSVGYFRADSTTSDTLGLSTSRVGLSWWAEDADGWVDHYQFRWLSEDDSTQALQDAVPWQTWILDEESDSLRVVAVSELAGRSPVPVESDTFIVRLTRERMTVRFQVRAIDNDGAVDASPASTVFPAFNQVPRLDWVAQSQELLSTSPPDTGWTFGYNSFHFNAWDLDGNETITRVLWALDDTSAWIDLPPGQTTFRLTPAELEPGPHQVFVKAQDIAEAWSETLVYPPPPDSTETPLVWMVRPLFGNLLVAFDDQVYTQGPALVRQGLAGMGYEEDVDYTFWDATQWVPYDDHDLQAVFDSFAMLFWVSYMRTQLESMCDNLDIYMARSGRLLIGTTDFGYLSSSGYVVQFDTPCLPLDSLTHQRHYLYPPPGRDNPITPAADFLPRYPTLHVTTRISMRGNNDLDFGFVPDDSSSVELYYVPEDPDHAGNPRVTVGARRPADGRPDKAKEIFLTLPLWYLSPLDSLFRTVIEDEFNW